MRPIACTLLIVWVGLGCARIYRPIALVPTQATVHGDGLSGQATLQPWGDNSRYERKALNANLRLVALTLENATHSEVEVLRLELPGDTASLSPDAATQLIKQHALAYLLYPLVPGVAAMGANGGGVLSTRTVFQGVAVIGAIIAIPNAIVATRSNHRLRDFFRGQTWSPGAMRPGQTKCGLIFLRSQELYTPLPIELVFRTADGEHRLTLTCPGAKPLPL